MGARARTLRRVTGAALYRRRLAAGERVLGLGDKAFRLDRRGGIFELWNTDDATFAAGRDPLYKAIPIVFGVLPDRAWGAYVESTARLVFDCRDDELRVYGPKPAAVHELEGARLADVVARMSEVVGRAPLPPRWALGYHQSSWSYASEDEVRELAAEFRRRGIPLGAIHLDIDHMDGYRVFTWNRRRFPDPGGLAERIGVRLVAIVDPGIKAERGYAVHDDAVRQGFALTGPGGAPWVGRSWAGRSVWPDFTRPAVRRWWGDLHRGLVEAGVSGIWCDMNEPSVGHRSTLPDEVLDPEAHNAYGHLMARAAHEGLARLRPGVRPFVLTRAGCAGTQRYAATWTGDNHSTWTHLRLALRQCLGLGLSCFPFCGSDVGGFKGRCEPELFARWVQLGAFTPFFRTHYARRYTPGRQEPWSFGPEVEAVARAAIELRYELMPYTYTAFWRHTQTGLPVMRPLVLEWQDDARAAACEDAFLWGDSLLVAPVLRKGARRRRVYLPAGDWTDFWSGARLAGPRTVVAEAPLDRIPLYVRGGTVLPFADGRLRLYPGEGTSWLYEDDGETVAGPTRVTRFDVRGEEVSITSEGDFEGMPLDRIGR